MKDSGIEWIKSIPVNWECKRGKQLFIETNERSIAGTEELLTVSHITGVTPRRQKNVNMFMSESLTGYKICHPGDIAANTMWLWQGAVGVSNYHGVISPSYNTYRQRTNDYDSKYLDYLLRIQPLIDTYAAYSTGITLSRLRLYPESFLSIYFIVPPLTEQQHISSYLDVHCSEIDAMLSKTRSSIEEYKKLKQAVITQAVTKGVRGEREMKDSGVEWIGEINHRFSLIKLKYICSILDQYRKPISADKRSQSGSVLYDYYGASGAIDKIDDYTIDDHVMLIGEDGANLRMRNLPLMYEVNGKAWINNHAHILKPTERVDFYYLFYALEGLDINPYITGSAQPKLSQENLQNIWVPLPSLEEQQEIATYIRSKCAEIDRLIAKKEQLVKELESYKKSLIYEVVTGKREV